MWTAGSLPISENSLKQNRTGEYKMSLLKGFTELSAGSSINIRLLFDFGSYIAEVFSYV